jgi:hypothetical protein
MNNHTERRTLLPRGQRGGALIIVLIVISMVAVAVAVGMPSGVAAMKRINAAKKRGDDKWLARGRVATGDDFLYDTLRSNFKSDMQAGRVRLGGRVLPAFDSSDVPPSSSVPVMRSNEDGTTSPTGCEGSPGSCTSILGNVNTYLGTRGGLINSSFFNNVAVPTGTIKLADIRVVEKRTMTQGGETAFRVEYVLDATGGDNGRARQRGEVIFGVNDTACGTSIGAAAPEQTITRGQAAPIQVNYTRTKTLVLKAGGVEIERRSVQDDINTQTATFTVSPTADTTYTVDAGGTGVCTAQTFHTVHVQQPICPVNQLFDVSPSSVYGSGQVTVNWQVGGPPYEVRLNGALVSATGSMTVTVNSDTSFTLAARDLTNQCPFSVTRTVQVIPCPSLTSFDAEGGRTNITRGDPPVNLVWNVGNVAPGTRVLLNGVDVPAVGSQMVAPDVTTDYTLAVQPPPGAGCPPAQKTIRITVNDRPCPQLQVFEPDASTLTEGDLLMVRWLVAQATSTTSVRLIGPGVNELVAPNDSRGFTLAPGTYAFRLEVTSSYPECPGTQARDFSVTVNPKKPPDPPCDIVIQQFDPSTSCALPGSVVRLTWNVTSSNPATRVQINGSGSYPLVGFADVTVNSSQTFTLSADAPTCAAQTAARFVEVAQPAPTITGLSASTGTSPREGELVTIFYGASGAQTATINGSTTAPDGSPVNPAGGSFSFTASGAVDFTFSVASGGCSPQTDARTIQIRPAACPVPSIQFFRPNPASVPAGRQTLFEWAIDNAEPGATVSITGPGVNLTGLPASGSAAPIKPSAIGTHFFMLTVQNPCGGASVSQQTSVVVTCAGPVVSAFTASPQTYQVNSRAFISLAWTATDPDGSPVTVEIAGAGGGLPASGTVDVSAPNTVGTHSITLTARNACGASTTATVEVVVTPLACSTVTDPLPADQIPSGPEILYLRGRPYVTPCVPGDPLACITPDSDTSKAEFTWDTKGADSASINGTPVPVKGDMTRLVPFVGYTPATYSDQPGGDTVYTLEAWHSSNPALRARISVLVKFVPPRPTLVDVMYLDVKNDGINHTPGSPVTIPFEATYFINAATRTQDGVTVDVEGIASGLPATGSVTIPAPTSTSEYKFIARRGGVTAVRYVTIIVEPSTNTGAGWSGAGAAVIPGIIPAYNGVGMRARVLSNGAIHIRHYVSNVTGSVDITGYVGGGGLYPTGFGYSAGGFAEIYKDGNYLTESLFFGHPSGFDERADTKSFGPGYLDEIIPASLIPNAGCGRVDFKYMGVGSFTWQGFLESSSPPTEIFDTRTGYVQPNPFGPGPFGTYNVVPSWTQAAWDTP